MSIELPRPNTDTRIASSAPSETVQYGNYEAVNFPKNVENKSTEAPAYQEVRTGHSAGDGSSFTQVNDVSATTNSSSAPTATTSINLDDVPVVAADEDLIEKQWVESVKRAIGDTRSDPYRQSEAISRLQADYLQKRYGRVIGQGNGGI